MFQSNEIAQPELHLSLFTPISVGTCVHVPGYPRVYGQCSTYQLKFITPPPLFTLFFPSGCCASFRTSYSLRGCSGFEIVHVGDRWLTWCCSGIWKNWAVGCFDFCFPFFFAHVLNLIILVQDCDYDVWMLARLTSFSSTAQSNNLMCNQMLDKFPDSLFEKNKELMFSRSWEKYHKDPPHMFIICLCSEWYMCSIYHAPKDSKTWRLVLRCPPEFVFHLFQCPDEWKKGGNWKAPGGSHAYTGDFIKFPLHLGGVWDIHMLCTKKIIKWSIWGICSVYF